MSFRSSLCVTVVAVRSAQELRVELLGVEVGEPARPAAAELEEKEIRSPSLFGFATSAPGALPGEGRHPLEAAREESR